MGISWKTKIVVFGVPAVIASALDIIFELHILMRAFTFGVLIFISAYTAKKLGYWKHNLSKKKVMK